MLNKLGPINRRTILGLLLIASLLLLVLGLTWVLTNSSAEDSWTFVQGEEQVGILEYANSEQISRTSWFVLVSGGLALAVGLYVGSQRPSSFSNEHQSPSPRIRLRQLILFSGISLALYALHFLLPFPLHRFYNFRRVSLGWITLREPVMAIGISVGIVTLFLVYIFAYRLCRGKNARRLWAVVLFGALIFSLLNFFVFPLTSTDVYDYVARGRITGVHEGNPYTDVPNDYPDDPYVQMAAWRKNTTVYGPLWEVLSGLIGRFAGDEEHDGLRPPLGGLERPHWPICGRLALGQCARLQGAGLDWLSDKHNSDRLHPQTNLTCACPLRDNPIRLESTGPDGRRCQSAQ
jgi:hypothetical protein